MDVRDLQEIPTNVFDVFDGRMITGLESREAVAVALGAHHNVLAELAALHGGLDRVARGSALTVVHHYEGVGEWMRQGWKTRRAATASVVQACMRLIADRALSVTYQHQRGHQSTWAGRDDFAMWNGRDDELARGGRQLLTRDEVPR